MDQSLKAEKIENRGTKNKTVQYKSWVGPPSVRLETDEKSPWHQNGKNSDKFSLFLSTSRKRGVRWFLSEQSYLPGKQEFAMVSYLV